MSLEATSIAPRTMSRAHDHRTAARAIEACGRIAAMAPPMSETAMLTAARFEARAWTAADYDRAMAVQGFAQETIGEARALEDPQLFEVWGGWVVKEALRAHVASGALSKPAGARVIAYWIMLGAKAGAKELVIALGAHAAAKLNAYQAHAEATQLRARAPSFTSAILERAAALGVSPEEYQAHVYPSRTPPARTPPGEAPELTPAMRRHAEAIGVSAEEYAARVYRK